MEKAKISASQLFVLIFLFEFGTAIVVGLGFEAKKDAWLAVFLGLLAGLILFGVYYMLYRLYPGESLTGYLKQIFGKYIGGAVGILYLFYFLYDATWDIRDFGALLTTSTYVYTPLFVINALIVLAIAFVLSHGIEVLARTGEIFFMILMVMGFIGTVLVVASGMIHVNHLRPVLENGWGPVLKAAFPLTFTFPFGEMIAFTVLLPYLNRPRKGLKVGWSAMGISGVLLMWIVALDIAVLGVHVATRSSFPLLATISLINLPGIFQRLDAIVVLTLIIGGFFKIAILLYAATVIAAELFRVTTFRRLVLPFSIVVLLSSMTVANNFAGHLKEGLKITPMYVHLPFQTGIPLLLLATALIRKYVKSR